MASEAFSEYGSHAVIFEFILGKRSGVLGFQPGTRKLYFEEGSLVFASSEATGEHFSDILVTMGVLDSETLDQVREQMPPGESMGRKLKELGLATPAQLAQALKQQITTVVDRVFTTESGTYEVTEGPLTGRVPKLKIQILALIMRTISGMENNDFLDQVPRDRAIIPQDDFVSTLEDVHLPANYQPLVELLQEGSQVTTDEISDRLSWENRLVDGLIYVLHLIGAVSYQPLAEEFDSVYPPTAESSGGDVDELGLGPTMLDHENPLDLSIQDDGDDDVDATLIGLDEEEDALESSLDMDADEFDAEAPLPGMDEDEMDKSLDSLEASLPEDDDNDDFSSGLGNEFDDELHDDHDDNDPIPAGPPTDLLAAALDDTLDEEESEEDSEENPLLEDDDQELGNFDDVEDDDDGLSFDDNEDAPLSNPFAEESSDDEDDGFSFQDEPETQFGSDDEGDALSFQDEPETQFGSDDLLGDNSQDDQEDDDNHMGLDALDAAAETSIDDNLGLEAMDLAAQELENEGYGQGNPVDDEELDFGGYKQPTGDETVGVGRFEMDEEDKQPTFSGEFSAHDLEAASLGDENEEEKESFQGAAYRYEEESPAAFNYDESPDDGPEYPTQPNATMPDPDENPGSGLYQSNTKSRRPMFLAMVGLLVLLCAGALYMMNRTASPSQPAPEPQKELASSDVLETEVLTTDEEGPPEASGTTTGNSSNVSNPESGDANALTTKPAVNEDPKPTPAVNNQASTPTTKPAPKPERVTTTTPSTSARPTGSSTPATTATPFTGSIVEFSDSSIQRFQEQGKPYCIALMLACEQETVTDFLSSNSQVNLFVFPRAYNGRNCYTICWGAFETSAEAAQGRDTGMPESLKNYPGAWIKKMSNFLN